MDVDIVADTHIFIDYGVADIAVLPMPMAGFRTAASPGWSRKSRCPLMMALEISVPPDAGADADHRALDLGSVNDAAFGDHRFIEPGAEDLGRAPAGAGGINGFVVVKRLKPGYCPSGRC